MLSWGVMMRHVPIAVEGIDDRGGPSGLWLEVVEVALLDKDGAEIGRFRVPEQLWAVMLSGRFGKLVAIETTGEPGLLTCDFSCDEQAGL